MRTITLSNVISAFYYKQSGEFWNPMPMQIFVAADNKSQIEKVSKEIVAFNGYFYVLTHMGHANEKSKHDKRYPTTGYYLNFERVNLQPTRQLRLKYADL